MEHQTLRAQLIDEAARLKNAAADAAPTARVPTCPDWTAADLVEHVTDVYDHKTQCMRLGRAPEAEEKISRSGTRTERFDAALAELLGEFDTRAPEDPAFTWYEPDQTVGFWIRRMAAETVIHRADAELAAGRAIGPVEDAFAVDAIDEFLDVHIAWSSVHWHDQVAEELAANDGLTVGIEAGDARRTLRTSASSVRIDEGVGDDLPATVTGSPQEVLMWLWRRLPVDEIGIRGDAGRVQALHAMLATYAD